MRKKDVHSRQSLIANSLENWFTTFDMRLVVNIKKHNYHGFKIGEIVVLPAIET